MKRHTCFFRDQLESTLRKKVTKGSSYTVSVILDDLTRSLSESCYWVTLITSPFQSSLSICSAVP